MALQIFDALMAFYSFYILILENAVFVLKSILKTLIFVFIQQFLFEAYYTVAQFLWYWWVALTHDCTSSTKTNFKKIQFSY